jgi:exodeoxyribonuclease VII small subunit
MGDEELASVLAAEPAAMSYEQARDGLVLILHRLEAGEVALEESLRLWERGEALASRCNEWLDAAQARIDAVTGAAAPGAPAVAQSQTGEPTTTPDMPF